MKRKGLIYLGGPLAQLPACYDVVGWDLDTPLPPPLAAFPNTLPLPDTSAASPDLFKKSVLDQTINMPPARSKIELLKISTDSADAVGGIDESEASWYIHVRAAQTRNPNHANFKRQLSRFAHLLPCARSQVHVRLTEFLPPASGVWCVYVNGEQVRSTLTYNMDRAKPAHSFYHSEPCQCRPLTFLCARFARSLARSAPLARP